MKWTFVENLELQKENLLLLMYYIFINIVYIVKILRVVKVISQILFIKHNLVIFFSKYSYWYNTPYIKKLQRTLNWNLTIEVISLFRYLNKLYWLLCRWSNAAVQISTVFPFANKVPVYPSKERLLFIFVLPLRNCGT